MDRDGKYATESNHYGARNQAGQVMPGHGRSPMVVELTPDELNILKECQYNAIFKRGLPLGAAALGGIYCLMKTGVLRKNTYSLALGGVTGFLIGTMSYRRICVEKLMALPNSTLKDRILIAQGKQPHVRVGVQPQEQSWFDSITPSAPMTSSLDIEPYNQTHQFDELTLKPDADSAYAVNPPLQPIVGTPYTTYDDLRRNNREQYERSRNYGYRTPDNSDNMRRSPNDPGPPSRNYGPNEPPPPSYDSRPNDPMSPPYDYRPNDPMSPPYDYRPNDPILIPPRRSDDFIP